MKKRFWMKQYFYCVYFFNDSYEHTLNHSWTQLINLLHANSYYASFMHFLIHHKTSLSLFEYCLSISVYHSLRLRNLMLCFSRSYDFAIFTRQNNSSFWFNNNVLLIFFFKVITEYNSRQQKILFVEKRHHFYVCIGSVFVFKIVKTRHLLFSSSFLMEKIRLLLRIVIKSEPQNELLFQLKQDKRY